MTNILSSDQWVTLNAVRSWNTAIPGQDPLVFSSSGAEVDVVVSHICHARDRANTLFPAFNSKTSIKGNSVIALDSGDMLEVTETHAQVMTLIFHTT